MTHRESLNVKVKQLSQHAVVPTKAHGTDAGWDLYAAARATIAPGETKIVSTGIAMEIPAGWYGQIKSRSGLGARGLVVTAGVVDSSYRGEIGVVVINTSLHRDGSRDEQDDESGYFTFRPGDRIAQMVFLPVPEVVLEIVDSLEESARGANGFGSTGIGVK